MTFDVIPTIVDDCDCCRYATLWSEILLLKIIKRGTAAVRTADGDNRDSKVSVLLQTKRRGRENGAQIKILVHGQKMLK